MSAYTSKKSSYANAKLFKESFYSGTTPNLGYVFIGKNLPKEALIAGLEQCLV